MLAYGHRATYLNTFPDSVDNIASAIPSRPCSVRQLRFEITSVYNGALVSTLRRALHKHSKEIAGTTDQAKEMYSLVTTTHIRDQKNYITKDE